MNNKVWTVVRFPNGSWSYGGKPSDPDYVECKVFRITAIDGKAAVKKAQAMQNRERRRPMTSKQLDEAIARLERKISLGRAMPADISKRHALAQQREQLYAAEQAKG